MGNFKSGFEKTLDIQLSKSGMGYKYEPIKLAYTIHHEYSPDWVLDNGIIIEAKGRFMKGDTAKMKAVKQHHPHLDIRFVFQSADKKIMGQKNTHEAWADRNGFPYAVGRIPDDWLK